MFCMDCLNHSKCIKVCRPLELYLQREQSREGYSERHLRRKEIPTKNIDDMATKRAFQIKYHRTPLKDRDLSD